MKKLLLSVGIASMLLAACGEETKEVAPIANTIEEYEALVPAADFEEFEEGRYMSTVNPDIAFFADVDGNGKVAAAYASAVTTNFEEQREQIQRSFTLLVESVDGTLDDAAIAQLFNDLGMTWNNAMFDTSKVKMLGDVTYTYKGDVENNTIVLRAEKK